MGLLKGFTKHSYFAFLSSLQVKTRFVSDILLLTRPPKTKKNLNSPTSSLYQGDLPHPMLLYNSCFRRQLEQPIGLLTSQLEYFNNMPIVSHPPTHNCDFEAATSSRICFPQQEGSSAGASYLSAELVYARPHFALSSKETLRHICVYQNGW